jgi:hypothetical protein
MKNRVAMAGYKMYLMVQRIPFYKVIDLRTQIPSITGM